MQWHLILYFRHQWCTQVSSGVFGLSAPSPRQPCQGFSGPSVQAVHVVHQLPLLIHSHLDAFAVPSVVFLMAFFLRRPLLPRSLKALHAGKVSVANLDEQTPFSAPAVRSPSDLFLLEASSVWSFDEFKQDHLPRCFGHKGRHVWSECDLWCLGSWAGWTFSCQSQYSWAQSFASFHPCADGVCFCSQHLVVMAAVAHFP